MGARHLAGAVCICLLAIGVLGCASGGDGEMAARQRQLLHFLNHCRTPPEPGGYVRARLHNSGISCGEAMAINVLLVSREPKPQQVDAGPGRPWVCRELPRSQFPLTRRCERGQRFFTVEDVRTP